MLEEYASECPFCSMQNDARVPWTNPRISSFLGPFFNVGNPYIRWEVMIYVAACLSAISGSYPPKYFDDWLGKTIAQRGAFCLLHQTDQKLTRSVLVHSIFVAHNALAIST